MDNDDIVVSNIVVSNIVVSEYELQSRYYVHFRTNTLGKGKIPLSSTPDMGWIAPQLFFFSIKLPTKFDMPSNKETEIKCCCCYFKSSLFKGDVIIGFIGLIAMLLLLFLWLDEKSFKINSKFNWKNIDFFFCLNALKSTSSNYRYACVKATPTTKTSL